MTNYLVTGGVGFIGSNFVRRMLATDDEASIVNLDLLTYAGVAASLDELSDEPRHRFVHGDIRDADLVDGLMADVDVVVNFAAESHVDRSITDPTPFLETNVLGTGVVLEAARRRRVPVFVQVSTDEVYGSVEEGAAGEDAPLLPSSPYSASKAAADLLVRSYAVTHGYEAIITRCTNNFGPYQFPEKVIPRFVCNLLEGEPVPVYGSGVNMRDWIYVEDHCAAIMAVIDRGRPGEIYNIGADSHMTNVDLAHAILDAVGADHDLIEFVPDRPGHDLRYAVDSSKIRRLGWHPVGDFTARLHETVNWYRRNRDWWEPLRLMA